MKDTNNKIEFFISLSAIIFAIWLFFPDFDGKDTITSYSIFKFDRCNSKKTCEVMEATPDIYTINKSNKEVYHYASSLSNIKTYNGCAIIDVENWECRKKMYAPDKLKMVNGVIVEGGEESLYTIKYVPKWKWKLVKYFGYQPKIKIPTKTLDEIFKDTK